MGPTHNPQRPTISQANCATVHLLWTGYSQFDTAVIVTWVELVDLKADSLSKIARKISWIMMTQPSTRIMNIVLFIISKIQLVVYYQCCVLIGWATTTLYVIAH